MIDAPGQEIQGEALFAELPDERLLGALPQVGDGEHLPAGQHFCGLLADAPNLLHRKWCQPVPDCFRRSPQAVGLAVVGGQLGDELVGPIPTEAVRRQFQDLSLNCPA